MVANVYIDNTCCMLHITMSDLKVLANVHVKSIYTLCVAHYNVNRRQHVLYVAHYNVNRRQHVLYVAYYNVNRRQHVLYVTH